MHGHRVEFVDPMSDDNGINVEFVDQFAMADSEVEEVLYSKDLKDGMRVILEQPSNRKNCTPYAIAGWDKGELYDALRSNRWCTVTKIAYDELNRVYVFIGVYDDGTRITRRDTSYTTWVVKKESILAVKAAEAAKKAYEDLRDDKTNEFDGAKDFSGYKIDYNVYKAHDDGTIEETMRVLHEEPTEAEKNTTTDN